jgi:hypothetical protein
LPTGTLHVLPTPVVLVEFTVGLYDVAFAHDAVMHAPQVGSGAVTKPLPKLGKPARLIPLDTVTGVERVVLWR